MICTNCLEELHLAEIDGQTSPCCAALVTDEITQIMAEFDDYLKVWQTMLLSEAQKHREVLEYIARFPADSKKRRKTYSKPANSWPGRHYEGTKRPRKKVPPTKSSDKSLDITSVSNLSDGWTVNITGKYSYSVYGSDRTDARRKARSWLRDQGTSITVAEFIVESENQTEIHF